MKPGQFTGKIHSGHKQAAIEVPFDPAERWHVTASPIRRGRRGWAAEVSLGGLWFGSFIVPRSGRFWLLLDEEALRTNAASVGDAVAVSLRPARP
ncbi:MAG: DUF1905 domain-containing protein [Dokdonella sp.]